MRPAQEIADMLRQHKAAKKIKVNTTPDRRNPDTTFGLCVNEGTLAKATEVQR